MGWEKEDPPRLNTANGTSQPAALPAKGLGKAEGHPPHPTPSPSTLWEPQRCSSQDRQESTLWLSPGLHTAAQVTWWAGDFQGSGEIQRPLILDALFS